VKEILNQCQKSAEQLLRDNIASLETIAEHLLEKESITGKEFMLLLSQGKKEQF